MDDAFLVRVMHAVADLQEQIETIAGGQPISVAVRRDGLALGVLHDEVGAALWRGARIEHLGNGRMVHHGQRLTLGLEAGDDSGGVHSGLDHLDGHLTADRSGLLGQPDLAHSAFTDALNQSIGADDER